MSKSLIFSVDDDLDILELIQKFLAEGGYEVITADRGEKALQLLDVLKPDLVLTDIVMPEMDGYEFCARLNERKKFAFIPIVFLSSLGEEADKAKAFALGAVDFLTKPFRREKLLSVVEKQLEQKEQWAELGKVLISEETKKLHPDFEKFKEFLSDRLNLPPGRREKLSDIGSSQLYLVSAAIGATNTQMAKLISEFFNLPYAPFIDPEDVQLGILPVPFSSKNHVIAKGGDSAGGYVFVLSNPFNWELMDTLKAHYKEFRIAVTEPENIELLLKYGSGMPAKSGVIEEEAVKILKTIGEEKKEQAKTPSKWELERHPIIYMANNILVKAVAERASDIHIEPKETNAVVRFRVDGDMIESFTLEKKTSVMLLSRYKILAGMDIAEKRKPQDGGFEAIIDNRGFNVRCATTSTPRGESLIMRLLEPSVKSWGLTQLGMSDKQAETMTGFAGRHQGFVLVVGSTGSGKTTTIYSLLSSVDGRTRSLMTVEDPVEYTIPFANQEQVNVKAGVTFEVLLKSSVRQDPDILYLGEMRDPESAKIAVDFASTGHLVITTMHTANATTAIFRLERLGINRWVMAEALLGVVAQRLLKKLCPHCKKIVPISKEEMDMLAPFTDEVPSQVAHPAGCLRCNERGYLGREGVYEVIEFDHEISNMIRSDIPVQEIRKFVRKRGDYLMSDHAVEKVREFILAPKDAYEKVLVEDREFEGEKLEKPKQKAAAKMSILVVDDDKDTRKLLAYILENEGYEVTIAEDGIDALLHLGKKDFGLVLSDIDMPNLDGFKLLEMKNQKGIEAPVIFLTAQSGQDIELKGFELGAADYIRKPIKKELLLPRIKKVLQ